MLCTARYIGNILPQRLAVRVVQCTDKLSRVVRHVCGCTCAKETHMTLLQNMHRLLHPLYKQ